MKNLKEDRRKILTLILIFSVILIFIYKIAQDKNLNSQQDIIFFKLFNSNYLIQIIQKKTVKNPNSTK